MLTHLTSSDVARLLACSRWTVLRIDRADLPYVTTRGRHRRYLRDDVEQYLLTRAH